VEGAGIVRGGQYWSGGDCGLQRVKGGLKNKPADENLRRMPLVIGMPVMICQNFDVEHGVVNGCTGIF
jgi:hypothetical protein